MDSAYARVLQNAQLAYEKHYHPDKKQFALNVMASDAMLSAILFRLYDGKPVEKTIWKMVKPKYAKPFKSRVEE